MKFINPKTDFAFKKIFGSEGSKDILISFLNAILYNEESVIEDLEIINPLLNILDQETISQTTGISIEEIQSLREED